MKITRALGLTVFGALLLLGCGEDTGTPTSDETSARLSDAEPLPQGDPLVMTKEKAGLPLSPPIRRGASEYRGDLTLISSNSGFDLVTTRFDNAVITVQMLDEKEARFSSPDQVRDNPAAFQPRKRVGDLFDEIDQVLGDANVDQWTNYTLVFDLFRVAENWLVRWDGVKIDEISDPGQYGLWRDDMRRELTDLVFAVLDDVTADRNVTHVVIGDDMERLLLGKRNFPNNPEEFANFVSFYKELRAAIKADFPDIKISAGMNWDRLVTDVAALYTTSGNVEDVRFGEIRRVWQDIAEPLYSGEDFLALSSEPDPSYYEGDPAGLPESQYALLAEVQGERPVVWYGINWPINSSAEKRTQKDYLERFLELNAGNEIDLITWRIMIDLPEQGDCALVTGLSGRSQRCFAGFFSNSAAPTSVSDLYIPAE
jgi:hypothetical protein